MLRATGADPLMQNVGRRETAGCSDVNRRTLFMRAKFRAFLKLN
jgi:hypothetical protein